MKNKKKKRRSQSQTPPNLYELLLTLKDPRRGQGRMHPLALILVIVIMATMSGCGGQRATGDFVKKHRQALLNIFHPKHDRLPSYQTIARVMQRTDFHALSALFSSWAASLLGKKPKDWIALDGKALGGTVQNPHDAYQTFTHLVTAFSTQRKLVLSQGKVDGKHHEIALAKHLIQELDLAGVVFTLDALHAQKDTTQAIIQSKNNYVIGVKGNQKHLLTTLKKTSRAKPAWIAIV